MTSNIDEQVRQAMRAAADSIEPPVRELVDGGLKYGRKLRRRHKVAVVGASLAASAVVVGGALVAVNPAEGRDVMAALGLTVGGDVASGVTSDQPVTGEAGIVTTDGRPVSSEDVLEILTDLLPPGDVVSSQGFDGGEIGGFVTYDDGLGVGAISASLSALPAGMTCYHPSPQFQCTQTELDDGSILWIIQVPEYMDGRQSDVVSWWAILQRADGLKIDLRQNNSAGEKDAQATRAEPLLSVEQMEVIVMSERWQVFEVDPARQVLLTESREQVEAASRRLTDALGNGWAPVTLDSGAGATPTSENAAGLPDGYAYVLMFRDVFADHPGYVRGQVCEGWTEDGTERDPCLEMTTPSGELVHLLWSRSVDQTISVPMDELMVMYVNDENDVVRVTLTVSDEPGLSTPERRAHIVAWIEQQIDAMIAAATAEDATTR